MADYWIVLAVDDEQRVLDDYSADLRVHTKRAENVELVTATTLEAASALFERHGNVIDALILDGCVGESFDATLPFIATVMGDERFTGLVVAASSSRDLRLRMVEEANCHHEAPKEMAIQRVLELLRNPSRQQ